MDWKRRDYRLLGSGAGGGEGRRGSPPPLPQTKKNLEAGTKNPHKTDSVFTESFKDWLNKVG